MKRRLIFPALVIFAILAQLGLYSLLILFGLRQESGLLICLTILSGVAFWRVPFWYTFVYSKKQQPAGSDIAS